MTEGGGANTVTRCDRRAKWRQREMGVAGTYACRPCHVVTMRVKRSRRLRSLLSPSKGQRSRHDQCVERERNSQQSWEECRVK